MKYCHCMLMLVNMNIRLMCNSVLLLILCFYSGANSQCLCCAQRSHVPAHIFSCGKRYLMPLISQRALSKPFR